MEHYKAMQGSLPSSGLGGREPMSTGNVFNNSLPTPSSFGTSPGPNKFEQYKKLVNVIFQKLPASQKSTWLPQIDKVVSQLLKMSAIGHKIQSVVLDNNLSFEEKMEALQTNDMLTSNEAQVLLKALNFQNITPGQQQHFNSAMGASNWHNMDIFRFMIKYMMYIPNYMMTAARDFFSYFTGVHSDVAQEFSEPIDIIYMALFVFASVPFFGVIADFLIIIRAMMEGKIFLALLTVYSVFISLFQYHFFDMGLVFKGFYGLDSFSHSHDRRMRKKLGLPETGPIPESAKPSFMRQTSRSYFGSNTNTNTAAPSMRMNFLPSMQQAKNYFTPHQQMYQGQFSNPMVNHKTTELMQFLNTHQGRSDMKSKAQNIKSLLNNNRASIDNRLEMQVMPHELKNMTPQQSMQLENLFSLARKQMKTGHVPHSVSNLMQRRDLEQNASLLKSMDLSHSM